MNLPKVGLGLSIGLCRTFDDNLVPLLLIMAPDSAAKSARAGLSLYANLLDPSSNKESTPGTISRAPVVFKPSLEGDPQHDRVAVEKQQISAGRYEPAL